MNEKEKKLKDGMTAKHECTVHLNRVITQQNPKSQKRDHKTITSQVFTNACTTLISFVNDWSTGTGNQMIDPGRSVQYCCRSLHVFCQK